jgi:fluoride exporter
MHRYAFVAAGGLGGCLGRYWLAGAVQQVGFEFPAGTLAVNILGSVVIGVVMTLSLDRGLIDAELRILLTTGFCGGFTTMSTFSYETIALLRSGENWLAFGNFAATNTACFAAVWLGGVVARLL